MHANETVLEEPHLFAKASPQADEEVVEAQAEETQDEEEDDENEVDGGNDVEQLDDEEQWAAVEGYDGDEYFDSLSPVLRKIVLQSINVDNNVTLIFFS